MIEDNAQTTTLNGTPPDLVTTMARALTPVVAALRTATGAERRALVASISRCARAEGIEVDLAEGLAHLLNTRTQA